MGRSKGKGGGGGTAAVHSSNHNDGVLNTRNLILRCLSVVYLCAFLTFYYQSPGLFGSHGIMPAQFLKDSPVKLGSDHIKNPTLLHYTEYIGLDVQYMMDFIALIGAGIAFLGFISQAFCILPIFAILWILYFSLVKVTSVFDHQSDYLLLEVGFVALVLAPLARTKVSEPADKIGITLLKWVLFRFLFDSGSVKFFSGCPLWWSFQGLSHHFQTMPLPTPLSWYSHYLPNNFMMVTNIYTNLSELVCPWFFFFPSRAVRIFLFYWEIYLQLTIVFTGNYGYLNVLVTTMLLTLLDDKFLKARSITRIIFEIIIASILLTAGIYAGAEFLDLKSFAFKYEHLGILRSMARLAPLVAAVAIIATFLTNIISHPSIASAKSFLNKASSINTLLAFTLCSLALVGVSVVPHNNIDSSLNITNTQLGRYYQEVNKYYIVNEYGRHLRRMRTERVEIVFEYSNEKEGPWKELPFIYKPWNENASLPYAGPYLARLDMKFYDAVVTSYRDHSWLMPLSYRILTKEPNVLRLFGVKGQLQPAPRFVRSKLYRFAFTPNAIKTQKYWKRTYIGEHLPTVSLDDPILTSTLNNLRYPQTKLATKNENQVLKNILDIIRQQMQILQPHVAVFSVVITGLVLSLVKG